MQPSEFAYKLSDTGLVEFYRCDSLEDIRGIDSTEVEFEHFVTGWEFAVGGQYQDLAEWLYKQFGSLRLFDEEAVCSYISSRWEEVCSVNSNVWLATKRWRDYAYWEKRQTSYYRINFWEDGLVIVHAEPYGSFVKQPPAGIEGRPTILAQPSHSTEVRFIRLDENGATTDLTEYLEGY